MLFSATTATSINQAAYSEKPPLPPGRHLLTCERVIEEKKDGTQPQDRDGDPCVWVVFAPSQSPDRADILQRVYIDPHGVRTDAEKKLGRSRQFIGNFLAAAGIQSISTLEELVGLMAYAQITRNKQYVNIDKWEVKPTPIPQPLPEQPRRQEFQQDQGTQVADDDVPF